MKFELDFVSAVGTCCIYLRFTFPMDDFGMKMGDDVVSLHNSACCRQSRLLRDRQVCLGIGNEKLHSAEYTDVFLFRCNLPSLTP